MIRNYGAVPPSGAGLPARRKAGALTLLAGVTMTVATVFVLVTLGASTSRRDALLGIGLADAPAATPAPVAVDSPQNADWSDYAAGAKTVLDRVEMTDDKLANRTDLTNACGTLLTPCLATVGACVSDRLVTAGKQISARPSACQCFVRGLSEPKSVPGKPGVEIACSFECLNSIKSVFEEYMEKKNGPLGQTIKCEKVFNNMQKVAFGSRNGEIVSESDTDALKVDDLEDPKALRAAQALQAYINTQRTLKCPNKALFTGTPKLVYASHGHVANDKSQYRLEIVVGGKMYEGRVAHLPADDDMSDKGPGEAPDDTSKLIGDFVALSITPDACAQGLAAQLAGSESKAKEINSQGLSWKASATHLRGQTMADRGMGWIPEPLHVQKSKTMVLPDADVVIPKEYDARDFSEGEAPCAAFDVLNQGSCGSCYAFAAATAYSARLCLASNRNWNVVVSPQELMDCDNGCDGGNCVRVFQTMATKPTVPFWCDPYEQKKNTCGGACGDGLRFSTLAGTAQYVGGYDAATATEAQKSAAIRQMQIELISNGPGTIGMDVYDDFQMYSGGVYSKSASAKKTGGHAMALLGWGTDKATGVDYWLVQNSWGTGAGEKGFYRIRRGTNEGGLESYGLQVVKPQIPSVCSNVRCKNGGELLKSCSCKCQGGWSGATCDTCNLKCQNGGVLQNGCTSCACPLGFSGNQCQNAWTVTTTAFCADSKEQTVTVNFNFATQDAAPTQKSWIGIYPVSQKSLWETTAYSYICGSTFDKTVRGGRCPQSGTLTMKLTAPAAAEYNVAVASFMPPNEFGQSGWPTYMKDSDIVGKISVLGAPCDATKTAAAATAKSPATLFQNQIKALEAAEQAKRADMYKRDKENDAVAAQINAMRSAGATLSISGLTTSGYIWATGTTSQFCFQIPAVDNVNPKYITLYDTEGYYYSTALINAGPNTPAPTAAQACMNVGVSTGLTGGKTYIAKLTAGKNTLAQKSFIVGNAEVGFNTYSYSSAAIDLTAMWSVTPSLATKDDWIGLVNTKGTVVDWIYTSCKCKTAPGSTAVASGTYKFSLQKAGAVLGGYVVKFYPAGTSVAVAVDQPWIDWRKIGW